MNEMISEVSRIKKIKAPQSIEQAGKQANERTINREILTTKTGGAQEARGTREEKGRSEGSSRGSGLQAGQKGFHDGRAQEEAEDFVAQEGRRGAQEATGGQGQREASRDSRTDGHEEEFRLNERNRTCVDLQGISQPNHEPRKRKMGSRVRGWSQGNRGKSSSSCLP